MINFITLLLLTITLSFSIFGDSETIKCSNSKNEKCKKISNIHLTDKGVAKIFELVVDTTLHEQIISSKDGSQKESLLEAVKTAYPNFTLSNNPLPWDKCQDKLIKSCSQKNKNLVDTNYYCSNIVTRENYEQLCLNPCTKNNIAKIEKDFGYKATWIPCSISIPGVALDPEDRIKHTTDNLNIFEKFKDGAIDLARPNPASIEFEDFEIKDLSVGKSEVKIQENNKINICIPIKEVTLKTSIDIKLDHNKKSIFNANNLLLTKSKTKNHPKMCFEGEIKKDGIGPLISINPPDLIGKGNTGLKDLGLSDFKMGLDFTDEEIKSFQTDVLKNIIGDIKTNCLKDNQVVLTCFKKSLTSSQLSILSTLINSVDQKQLDKSKQHKHLKELATKLLPLLNSKMGKTVSSSIADSLTEHQVIIEKFGSAKNASTFYLLTPVLNQYIFSNDAIINMIQKSLNDTLMKKITATVNQSLSTINFRKNLKDNDLSDLSEKLMFSVHGLADKTPLKQRHQQIYDLYSNDFDQPEEKYAAAEKILSSATSYLKGINPDMINLDSMDHLQNIQFILNEIKHSKFVHKKYNIKAKELEAKYANLIYKLLKRNETFTKNLNLRASVNILDDIKDGLDVSVTSSEFCNNDQFTDKKSNECYNSPSKIPQHDLAINIDIATINQFLNKMYKNKELDFCTTGQKYNTCKNSPILRSGQKCDANNPPKLEWVWDEKDRRHYYNFKIQYNCVKPPVGFAPLGSLIGQDAAYINGTLRVNFDEKGELDFSKSELESTLGPSTENPLALGNGIIKAITVFYYIFGTAILSSKVKADTKTKLEKAFSVPYQKIVGLTACGNQLTIYSNLDTSNAKSFSDLQKKVALKINKSALEEKKREDNKRPNVIEK